MIGTSLLFSGSIGGLLTPFDSVAPTAGYSLRNLGLSYSGAVVRVRKDITGNPEQDFTAGQITNGTLSDFLETLGTDAHSQSVSTQFEDLSDVSLICDCNSGGTDELDAFDALYENGFVSKWYDQFGSNDATQTTATDQPKIWDSVTGLVTENGKPALDFDGVDDFFIIPDFSHSTTLLCTTIVQNPDSIVSEFMFAHYRTDNNQRSFAVRFFGNSYGYATSSNGTAFTILNSNEITSSQTVYFSQYDGSQTGLNRVKGYVNGSQITYSEDGISTESLPSSVHSSTADFTIGAFLSAASTGSSNYDGNMQELIFYDTDQSANRTAIEDNINNYYDIY